MPSVSVWQAALYEIADRLEAGAAQWALAEKHRSHPA
jgi:hypothetical protein